YETMTGNNNKKSQYEELSLLTAMFNEDEFQWQGDGEQNEVWKSTLVAFTTNQEETNALSNKEVPPFRFRISLGEEGSWFNVFLPEKYPEATPECYFSWDSANRQIWNEVNKEIELRLKKRSYGECCVFELYQHARSFLQQHISEGTSETLEPKSDNDIDDENTQRICRVLIWTHHLLSLEKRKNICRWAEELRIWGYSKPGYPGIIIAEGLYDNVREYISRLKKLNWQAITVRSEEIEKIENALQNYDKHMKLRLGRDQPGISEMESMSEISSRAREAGLEKMFLTSMKINKKTKSSGDWMSQLTERDHRYTRKFEGNSVHLQFMQQSKKRHWVMQSPTVFLNRQDVYKSLIKDRRIKCLVVEVNGST
ncbi:14343_t:CDS:2, partial [Acaulospora morrowiae]